MTSHEKPYRFEMSEYRVYIRDLGYCACSPQHRPPIEAHHTETGGMGTKASDLLCVPLCWRCHHLLTAEGRRALERRYDLLPNELEKIGWNLLARFVERNVRSGRWA